ncbi:hypothetical protein C1645_249037 [Glomus cerebriforme]|uniref:Uncharacterized protein n=1 Tax=Glomus cerebriforme TaxID=658196 RepID=A0A397TH46_9GLOM|nr:hypothetical protein C1645_249037 [Glomus cerebriforme]
MQHQYAQAIDLSNIPTMTMEEVLNGRLHLGQRSFSSENRILQGDITEKSSYSKRDKSCKDSRIISPQQVPLQTFQWSSQEISQDYRTNTENIIKFENESPVVSMDEIYNNGNRNRGNNVKKLNTVPYSFHFNTFPTTHQFSENRFPRLENEIQTTLFGDENNFTDKSKVT